jgi:hypothetical protein
MQVEGQGMPELSKDIIALLQYLLPGFLVAWIYFGLTSHQKPLQFERVVQALIFALFVRFMVIGERKVAISIGEWRSIGHWDSEGELFASLVTAIALGLMFSYLMNSDRLHGLLRKFNLSSRSSHPSEWCTAFDTKKAYVVVHMKDERRLYGWPHIWPSDPTKGHLLIVQGSWLRDCSEDDGVGDRSEVAPESDREILIDVADVKWVEFVVNPEEENDSQTSTNLTAISRAA